MFSHSVVHINNLVYAAMLESYLMMELSIKSGAELSEKRSHVGQSRERLQMSSHLLRSV